MFYSAYESFYAMTAKSAAFSEYCSEAFGEDFSQDGFSDINQIKQIMEMFPKRSEFHILDMGCGSGKLLGFLKDKLQCHIHGFDYSENAIKTAISLNGSDSDFRVGVMDEIDYPDKSFDVILSMDSIYFSQNMPELVRKINRWLKPDGIFIAGYQEGDVMPKTENVDSSAIAAAFRKNNFSFTSRDITRETYELLVKKRNVIKKYKSRFDDEGISMWYDVVLHQTDSVRVSFEEYIQNNARYIYSFRKQNIN